MYWGLDEWWSEGNSWANLTLRRTVHDSRKMKRWHWQGLESRQCFDLFWNAQARHKQGPIQKLQRGCPPPAPDTPFFTVVPQKGQDAAPKRGNKGGIRGRTRVAIKARAKGKVRTRKVDRTRSPPFRLVLVWVFYLLLILHFWHALAPARRHLGRSGGWALSFVFLCCILFIVILPLLSRRNGSLSSSPPFRLALAWSLPPSMPTLVGTRCILKVQLTTIEVGPGFASSHPAHCHWGWPWIGNFLLFFYYLPYSSFSSLAAPARWNPKWFGSKVIILLLFLRRLLPWNGPKWSALSKFDEGTGVSLVRSPSTSPVLVVLALEPPFSSSYLMLLSTTLSPLQIDEMAVIFWRWICMVPSMCCPFSQDFLGRILHALEMFSLCPLYGSYWLRLWLLSFWTPFSTKVWLGLTICWRRTSERNLSVGSLHALVPCFTRFHQALGWSSCLALSNQQARVRPTVSLDDQGH